MGRKAAEEALQQGFTKDPFAALAYASRQDDVALGKRAVRSQRPGSDHGGSFDFWAKVSDTKLSWQVALAKIMLR